MDGVTGRERKTKVKRFVARSRCGQFSLQKLNYNTHRNGITPSRVVPPLQPFPPKNPNCATVFWCDVRRQVSHHPMTHVPEPPLLLSPFTHHSASHPSKVLAGSGSAIKMPVIEDIKKKVHTIPVEHSLCVWKWNGYALWRNFTKRNKCFRP
ncbi:hypothetical protein HNY73_002246 [Argiope bruennichi]|uniref:Uncharacterized protein n=1 Tax=Argiope bruennichi TaxID=94029 RepID=A0A8T0FX77_ARGBR|nr:hypothetical protein HNY73_002246 [Argiope bruennichi]